LKAASPKKKSMVKSTSVVSQASTANSSMGRT
jgi:hypothetical protein